jgi:hypothetical protein
VKKLFHVTIAVLCIFALAMWLRDRFETADNRQTLAQSWSSDDAQFVAIGTDNRTLYAALPVADPVSCDAFIASVVTDKEETRKLRELGFDRIQCGDRKGRL